MQQYPSPPTKDTPYLGQLRTTPAAPDTAQPAARPASKAYSWVFFIFAVLAMLMYVGFVALASYGIATTDTQSSGAADLYLGWTLAFAGLCNAAYGSFAGFCLLKGRVDGLQHARINLWIQFFLLIGTARANQMTHEPAVPILGLVYVAVMYYWGRRYWGKAKPSALVQGTDGRWRLASDRVQDPAGRWWSADGQWWWDGQQWQPKGDLRS